MTTALLEVRDLATHLLTPEGLVRAVDGISFHVNPGETLGLVGESGCGKSVTALSILRLVPSPPGRHAGGTIVFDGQDLTTLPLSALQDLRGDRIGMIFQEPMTSLNPAYTIGDQIGEALQRHRGVSAAEARERTIALLRRVRIPAPETRVDDYPHRLSGGMRQRVMIAMALACDPVLLIADEPTTALDVTIQAQILDLLTQLKRETGLAMLLITHDLGVIADQADRVVVMYAGKVVEAAPVGALFANPQHPYTIGLLGSLPDTATAGERLAAIQGLVPSPTALPSGCRFRSRCPFAIERCAEEAPALHALTPEHTAACHRLPLDQVLERAA
ncbi:MAG: ABC transporter ATP-binding protein [Alphaproteobacteria bacterium]|nr:ABC transporter ATP-binding protein [Alphaproteobacteria bacterium]TAD90289.1 MAG: ABC transporter ATP-binding protein [Alphaproteobacteria bacterium]